MPRILIAGCGYVGQATAMVFREAGWEVEGWTLSAESAKALQNLPFTLRAVDVSDRTQVSSAASAFDRIIHCASSRGGDPDQYRRVYLNGVQNLLNVFPRTPLLFTSSTSVYAQTDGSWVSETDVAEPSRETGRILREAEELVLAAHGIVARLGGIYGPGRSFLLKKFCAGEAVIDREHDRFINQVHRDDIASALLLLSELGAAEIYNVVDNEPILLSECYEWLARELDRDSPPEGVAKQNRKRGDSDKRVSNKKLRALGWIPRYPTFADAMRSSILPSSISSGTQF